ncbi:phasin family protein [Microvirga antarctica]|uniref:phasin family protein n=1 Tax=Microvirga antarctica TaxID=2819233 RepID=UPI001B3027E4|nr:phasin family protein [Microvirga antarctica]
MIPSFDQFQKYGQENMEAALQAVGTFSKGAQAIATESSDFARKAFERNSSAIEQLTGARTIEKAVEIQTEYVKSAYEGMISQSTKLGELYSSFATEALKPVQGLYAKFTAA